MKLNRIPQLVLSALFLASCASVTPLNAPPRAQVGATDLTVQPPSGTLRRYSTQQKQETSRSNATAIKAQSSPRAETAPTLAAAAAHPPLRAQNTPSRTDTTAATTTSNSFRYEDLMWHLRKTNTPNAWRFTQGNPEIVVAVIDSGIDYNHPAFRGRVYKGFDFAGMDIDPMDESSHGTHVGGIIAGNDPNIRGVAPNVKLMAIKVFNGTTFAKGEFVLARSIRYATQYGASIINLSLGSPTLGDCGEFSAYMRSINSAIDEAVSQGITVVTAAGNEGYGQATGKCSVQQNINQIPVVATNETDTLAAFSNYVNYGHPKAISAPGVNIFSSIPMRYVCNDQFCEMPYDYMDGTSMASPMVAGALALIRSAMYDDYKRVMGARQRKSGNTPMTQVLSLRDFFHGQGQRAKQQLTIALTPAQLSEQLLFSHTNIPGRKVPEGLIYEGNRHPIYGFGRVDIGAAVESAARVFTAAGL